MIISGKTMSKLLPQIDLELRAADTAFGKHYFSTSRRMLMLFCVCRPVASSCRLMPAEEISRI